MAGMIEIDGSLGEGGGQILRTSLALALLTGKSVRLRHIRAKRDKPGLRPQHLMSVQAAAAVGQARTTGASIGSSELVFEPGAVLPGKYHFRIGTAGATGLVLHTVYLPLALAAGPSEVVIEGGTHVPKSPCYHFLDTTWRAYMALLGVELRLKMRRPGFYPRGGGLIEAHIPGSASLLGLTLPDLGAIRTAGGFSAVAGLPDSIARRQAERAQQRLKRLGLRAALREENWPGGPGTALGVELPTTPVPTLFVGLGARGKPAERVADEAVEEVESFLQAEPTGVDFHSADQLVLPLALAPEPSAFRVSCVSRHLLTNIAVIRLFLDRPIECAGEEGAPGWVRIT